MNGYSDSRTAALWAWGLGGAQTLLFGCCSGCLGAAVAVPDEAWSGIPLPPGATLATLRIGLIILAIGQLVVLALPSIAVVVLGFYIRQGRDAARRFARIILVVQAAILGGVVVLNLISAAMMGQLLGVAPQAVLVAGIIALQLSAIRALAAPLGPAAPATRGFAPGDSDEPWNSHLPR